jgi:hypothetical protein
MTCPNEGSGYCRENDCELCTPELMEERIADLYAQLVDDAWTRHKEEAILKNGL